MRGRAVMGRGIFRGAILVAGLALGGAGAVLAQMQHGPGHGPGHGHFHGARGTGYGTGHDEVTMPGLRGANASPAESAEIAVLFRNFDTITREVEILPDGIRTVTRSSDPEVMAALVSHTVGMIGRVDAGDDPQILIQSPTLDILFARVGAIASETAITDAGIEVRQTSEDPEVVEALWTHAAEVSAMADRGMQAVHEMMMARAAR